MANGKYIAFCDGDDIMKENMLEQMVLTAEKHHTDIVMCGYETFPGGGEYIQELSLILFLLLKLLFQNVIRYILAMNYVFHGAFC